MLELGKLYHLINKNEHSFTKIPIKIQDYVQAVKLSVIGVEFRDKLLKRNQCPKLLSHCDKALRQTSQKAVQSEIIGYIEQLNSERSQTMKLLSREFRLPLTMQRKCNELVELNEQRLVEFLGKSYSQSKPDEDSDSFKTDSDLDSSVGFTDSDLDDLLSQSQKSKLSHKPTRTAAPQVGSEQDNSMNQSKVLSAFSNFIVPQKATTQQETRELDKAVSALKDVRRK